MAASNAPSDSTERARALQLLKAYALPYRRAAGLGLVGTFFVVATRITLPWPLRGVIEVVFPGSGEGTIAERVPGEFDPVLVFCGLYLVLAFASGLAEFHQRVQMTRLASRTVRDLRASALAAVRDRSIRRNPADLVARVVGDSARLKANLTSFLVHFSQNALLLVGITALFLFLAPTLGLLLLASSLLALVLGYLAVEEVTETSMKQRRAESRYAREVYLHALVAGPEAGEDELTRKNRESTRKDVRGARLLGRATLGIHLAVSAVISIALWAGVQDVRAGSMAPGELFLFIAYALTLHRRAVRVGRQVARSGRIVAHTRRLGELLEGSASVDEHPRQALESELRLDRVRLRASPQHGRRDRVSIDAAVPAGARVAVLGGVGSGKSSLLQVLAGAVRPRRGNVLWDGVDVSSDPRRLSRAVGYLPEGPAFECATVGSLLGPAAADPDLLAGLRVARPIARLATGAETVLEGATLSPRERRALALPGALDEDAALWLLDCPLDGSSKSDNQRLATILDRAGERTVFVALRRPCLIEEFTHVWFLRKGELAFAGAPRDWRTWKANKDSETSPA